MRKLLVTSVIVLMCMSLPLAAFDGFTDIFGEPELPEQTTQQATQQTSFTVDGSVGFSIEGTRGEDEPFKGRVDIGGGLDIDLSWRGSMVDARTSFSLHPSNDTEFRWYDVFTGLSLTAYYEGGFVEAGLLKKEWGSGDGVHVVDVLNAPDYRNGFVDDAFAMKVAEPMVGSTTRWDDTTLEVFYKPMLIPMMAAEDAEDQWSMYPPGMGAIEPPTYEDLARLGNWQGAARLKSIVGPADVGLIYFNGFHTQPGYDLVSDPLSISIVFTRAQLFGAESTIVVGPFTIMLEGGFWLSEDRDGTDPTRYNSKWVYLGGIGYLFPDIGAYASVTYNGHYILDFQKGDLSDISNPNNADVDYVQATRSSGGAPYMNTLTAAFELPLARERVSVRLAGTYQLETGGYAFLPSITWSVTDDFIFKASGRLFGTMGRSEESIFKSWAKNDSLKMGISYLF
jgi:hypothetical protein